MKDIGLKKSWDLFNYISKLKSTNPIVLDSAEILNDPKNLLIKLCNNLDIDFYTDMLS